MLKRALVGLWATCVFLAPQIAFASNPNIVLYATDSSNLHGNWARVVNTTAAGGQNLVSSDLGWSNTGGPLVSPADYVDFTFNAPAATAYHMWLRMRAKGNSKFNDSVFVQFSDAVDGNGAAVSAIGTTNGLVVNLAVDAAATGLSGWGWQDGAYWLTQPRTIVFAAAGSHTLRIQTREDGVAIDQVVLSPTTYLATAPGGLANDTTIVPKPLIGVPAPWSTQDVGAVGLAGSASFANGLFSIAGAGADIWGTTDAFRLVSQAVPGDAQIVARVVSLQNVNTFAKAALMFRDTVSAGSAHVLIDLRPNGSIEFMSRAVAGGATAYLGGGTLTFPAWLRLTRSGATFTGEASPDGATWALIGTTTVAMGPTATTGLVVTSHDTSQLDTATFDNVAITLAPSTPAVPTPADTASGIALSTPLTWSASGATSYDVNFGTGSAPARVATGLTGATFTPSALVNGVRYFWQVAAHDSAGTTTGPVWSFTAIVAPPSAPGAPAPAAGAASVPISTALTWGGASGAASYDVRFGASNPPSVVATNLAAAIYTPPVMTNGATYFWQVVARNAGGSTAGPVWSFTAIIAPPSAPGAPTPTAGAVGVPLSSPLIWGAASGATSYDVSFGAGNPPPVVATNLAGAIYTPPTMTGGATYYWQAVARNAGGSTAGPVWSFTTIIGPPSAPGTPTPAAGAVNVPLSSPLIWGAVSGATSYDVSFGAGNPPPVVATNLAGAIYTPQTLTSGATYYWQVVARNIGGSTAGPVWSFSASTSGSLSPTAYNAIADRNAYAKPSLPALGPAGFTFNDPTFGSKMLRVTDGATRPDSVNGSFRIPSNSQLAAWNASSTAFFVESNDGTIIPYTFDATTMSASRMQPSSTGAGGSTLGFYVEPQFSLSDPNLIFGAVSGTNNRTIAQFDFKAGVYSTIVDLDTIVGGLANTYIGNVMTGGTSPEKLITLFGGASQDAHYYVMFTPVGNPAARKILNTQTSTINGVATMTPLNFLLHSAFIDKSGRFVFLGPRGVDLGAPRLASQVYVWDTDTDTITGITAAMLAGGHGAAGFGIYINQDCCTSSTWDAAQWQFRYLTSLSQTSDLISPVQAVKEVYLADHTTWNNAQPNTLVPIISSTYRYGANTAPWRAWDDEIIGIDTTGGIGGIVYRFAHHRSNVTSDTDPTSTYFWYQPIANVSPDGRWVVFTSNWEKTLGTDSREGTFRQDVFLVQLTPRP